MKNCKIFTKEENFKICKAYAIAATTESNDGYFDGQDVLGLSDDELLEKIGDLSDDAQTKFIKKVKKSVKQQLPLFESLPENINDHEAFQEQCNILDELSDAWAKDLSDFIIEEI